MQNAQCTMDAARTELGPPGRAHGALAVARSGGGPRFVAAKGGRGVGGGEPVVSLWQTARTEPGPPRLGMCGERMGA